MMKYFRLLLPLSIMSGTIMSGSLLFARVLEPVEQQGGDSSADNRPESGVEKKDPKVFSGGGNNAEFKSLLLSDSDIASIRSARNYYEQHLKGNNAISEDDFLKNLEKIATQNTSSNFIYPQFFLSSIAYRSARDWVVWINDEKITQDSGSSASGLRIIDINNEKATIEWQPERMDKITDIDYSSDESIKVDFMHKKVIFSLKANQTFSSYSMRILEGKVLPVAEDSDSAKMLGNNADMGKVKQ